MGQVAARIWTEVQKGKAQEMLLVALRKCGRLGEKTSVVCEMHDETTVVSPLRTSGLSNTVSLPGLNLEKLETAGLITADIWWPRG